MARAEGNNQGGRRTKDVQLENGDSGHVDDVARTGDNVTTRLEVAAIRSVLVTEVWEEKPGEVYSDPMHYIAAHIPAIKVPGLQRKHV